MGLAPEQFRWSDPGSWPWIIWLWLGIILAGWSVPAWRWRKKRRAADWPVADGRIESVNVTKPTFSFTTKRGYYVAGIAFSYSIAGTKNSGHYRREFPTERDADDFVRDLQAKPVVVRYDPNEPSNSMLLETDIEAVLQNRAPSPVAAYPLGYIPDWLRPLIWFFVFYSAVGLVVSLWVHLGAVMGKRVAPEPFFWLLHVGIFVVWFPAIFATQRVVGNVNRRGSWKVVLKGSPDWMRYMVYGFLGYAIVNFLIFMTQAPSGARGNPPAVVWRGFSGHWMAFYSAAFAMLYSAVRSDNSFPRCVNGHRISETAAYCPQCGQPATRTR